MRLTCLVAAILLAVGHTGYAMDSLSKYEWKNRVVVLFGDPQDDRLVRQIEILTSRCGNVDQPSARLIADLKERGMLDRTLVIWMGEFGRTPQINPRGGRDHFPKAFNVALAGGGVRGGQVIGATNDAGTEVTDRPVTDPRPLPLGLPHPRHRPRVRKHERRRPANQNRRRRGSG